MQGTDATIPAVVKSPARRPCTGVFLSNKNVAGPGEITTGAAIKAKSKGYIRVHHDQNHLAASRRASCWDTPMSLRRWSFLSANSRRARRCWLRATHDASLANILVASNKDICARSNAQDRAELPLEASVGVRCDCAMLLLHSLGPHGFEEPNERIETGLPCSQSIMLFSCHRFSNEGYPPVPSAPLEHSQRFRAAVRHESFTREAEELCV